MIKLLINKSMKLFELFVDYDKPIVIEAGGVGRIVPGINTTSDVGPNEVAKQAKKFGNKVTRDGRPPIARPDGKNVNKK